MRAKFLDETDYDEHDCTYEQIFDDLLLALRELVETRFKSESLDNDALKDAQDIAEQARNMVAILPNPDDQQEKMLRVEYKATYLLNAMNTKIPGTPPPELFESKSPFDEVEYPLDAIAESE
jgi:predicted ArsR family transcriptional regulator